jgi:hypothetical protein
MTNIEIRLKLLVTTTVSSSMWTYHSLLPLLDDFLTCQFVHVWCYITLIKNSVGLFIEFTGILLPILCSSPLGCCSWISLGHISLCPRSIWLDCLCLLIKTKNDFDCSVFCVSLAEEILRSSLQTVLLSVGHWRKQLRLCMQRFCQRLRSHSSICQFHYLLNMLMWMCIPPSERYF